MGDVTQPAKRMTLSQVLEMVLTRSSHDRSSVSLTRSASGEVVIDVKVIAETIEQASVQAQAELERLTALYPRLDGKGEPTVSLTRNAKGETQIDVKHTGVAETVEAYDQARAKYPMLDGTTAKAGSVA